MIEEVSETLNIQPAVVEQAKKEFTIYREKREALHNFEGTVLACLIIAYEVLIITDDIFTMFRLFIFEYFRFYFSAQDLSQILSRSELERPDRMIPVQKLAYQKLEAPRYKPHCEVVDDLAICTIPDRRLNEFSPSQLEEWLTAVAISRGSANCKFKNSIYRTISNYNFVRLI